MKLVLLEDSHRKYTREMNRPRWPNRKRVCVKRNVFTLSRKHGATMRSCIVPPAILFSRFRGSFLFFLFLAFNNLPKYSVCRISVSFVKSSNLMVFEGMEKLYGGNNLLNERELSLRYRHDILSLLRWYIFVFRKIVAIIKFVGITYFFSSSYIVINYRIFCTTNEIKCKNQIDVFCIIILRIWWLIFN